jgi:hypothetical protein
MARTQQIPDVTSDARLKFGGGVLALAGGALLFAIILYLAYYGFSGW